MREGNHMKIEPSEDIATTPPGPGHTTEDLVAG